MNNEKYNFLGNDWVEITCGEWIDLEDNGIQCMKDNVTQYFKKAEKYPKVFEGYYYQFLVSDTGTIIITTMQKYDHLGSPVRLLEEKDFEALRQAIAESDKIRGKQE